ncbi:MAG: transposase [bacterium]|nr:transposase [bacterium]
MRRIKNEIGDVCHIYNRGANKAVIFDDNSDRWRFLQGCYLFNDEDVSSNILHLIERENKGRINFTLLKQFIKDYRKDKIPLVKIMAICLMPNHFHLILQQISKDGISKFMHRLDGGYARYKNIKRGNKGGGSLFQGSYKIAKVEKDDYIKYLLAYVNVINPGQLIEPNLKENGIKDIDKIINFAREYNWSTNKEYLGIRESIIINKGILGDFFEDPKTYENFIKETLLSKSYNKIEQFMLD